jgi:hypothetical protein
MSNVHALPNSGGLPSIEPNEALVKNLEDVLAMAKSGQLQSFIGTGFFGDGARVSTWSDFHPNVYEMLGSLAWLHAEYIHRHTLD